MSYFFLSLKILLGVGVALFYIAVLYPWAVRLLGNVARREWETKRPCSAAYVAISLGMLVLPFGVPRFLAPVRLFYAAMAVLTILKLISYLKEHGWPRRLLAHQEDFTAFMHTYTINYPERPEPCEDGESMAEPRALKRRAYLICALVGAIGFLNVSLALWRYTPAPIVTIAKFVCVVLLLQATQDVLRARLIRKGLRPDLVLVDLRLFWSRTFELAMLRTHPMLYRWLLRYLYVPLGGRNHPIRNMMLCYVFSGILHEYMLAIASMKLSGLWFAYFAANGLLVCCESVVKPSRERLLIRLGERSFWYQATEVLFRLVNLLLTLALAHVLFMGLDQVIVFHR